MNNKRIQDVTMAPSLVTIDASEPLDKIIDVILRDGGVIVANMLSPELLNEVMGASKCKIKHLLSRCTVLMGFNS